MTTGPQAGAGAIAVVGMAGRFPGAPDVDQLWRAVRDGRDLVRRWRPDEWDAAGPSTELRADPGYVPVFGRLDGLADFDAEFFGYSDEEAARLDPQQRIFLELCWSALEHAGHTCSGDVVGGVFAGAAPNRYLLGNVLPALPAGERWTWPPGSSADYLPTRVSYALDLTGPSVAVQTACSSSLVAVCLAAQSLLDYRCDVALAGGVAVTSVDQVGYLARPGDQTSPTGYLRAFDATADGTVYGNGGAVVVLRRLEDALADGDHVHAVLRGWAVTNDGAARAGFASPGVDGQVTAIAEAWAAGGLEPDTVGLVEAHGGGTRLGDVIELEALRRAFGPITAGGCAVGSVKTNIGNLDAAAGVAGLVKAVLAVRHGVLPASLHHERPGPDAGLDGTGLYVPVRSRPWVTDGRPRRAGVNSFGLGGTNAHVVVEQAHQPVSPAPGPSGPDLLVLSAPTEAALHATAARLADALAELAAGGAPDVPATLGDVCWTLAVGRRPFGFRAGLVVTDLADAARQLAAGVSAHRSAAGSTVDWHLPGGDAPPGTGLAELPVHRAATAQCHAAFADLGVPPDRPAALAFTRAYALARQLAELGVPADGHAGVGIGAHVAAVLRGDRTLTEAARLAVADPAGPGTDGPLVLRVTAGALPAPADLPGLLALVGRLWTEHGVPVDWRRQSRPARRVPLPGYVFQRRRHWLSPPSAYGKV
ncbi:polyketide synthase [Micromonospora maritima]|uniref:polyketide synthase n=2 Tax=Micromonospora maritima TaxID=986711 RepID=UPI0031E89E7B